MQDVLNETFAPSQELLYDEVMVHGVPPDEKMQDLGFHQDTPWTIDLQSEGTPLDARHLQYRYEEDVSEVTAQLLAENKIVGWFQGRMESGPRALGGRSILMSPMRAENKDIINARVKFREGFRPFCPSILAETAKDYLWSARAERFTITSFDVRADKHPPSRWSSMWMER